jgi:Tfp pilus assembly protein FimT
MAEVALVMSITGILILLALPMFVNYYQASRLRSAAEEVVAFVNQGRYLGIRENTGTCVHISPTALQHRVGSSCTAAVWVGPGTDAAGNVRVPPGISLTTSADPMFNHLGSASPGATITLTNTQDGRTLRVIVAVSGRVRIGP